MVPPPSQPVWEKYQSSLSLFAALSLSSSYLVHTRGAPAAARAKGRVLRPIENGRVCTHATGEEELSTSGEHLTSSNLYCRLSSDYSTGSVPEMYLASSNHCNQYCGFVSSKQVFLAMCIIYLVLWVVILHLLLVLCNLYLALSNHCRGLVSCSII